MRSGYVALTVSAGTFRNTGQYGFWWSSRSYSTTTSAYLLDFNASTVYPSNYNSRWDGFPLRCLSTVLGMGGEMMDLWKLRVSSLFYKMCLQIYYAWIIIEVTDFYIWVGDSGIVCVLVLYLEVRESWLNQYHVCDVVSKDFTFSLCFCAVDFWLVLVIFLLRYTC